MATMLKSCQIMNGLVNESQSIADHDYSAHDFFEHLAKKMLE